MLYAIFSMLFYTLSVLLITPILQKAQSGQSTEKPNKTWFFLSALLAMGLHCVIVFYLQQTTTYSLIDVSSLMSLLIALLATIAMGLNVSTLWFLLPIIYGFAVINLVLATFVPSHIVHLHREVLIHIVLALFSYAVCFIAMLYSLQLAWLHRKLKSKKMVFSRFIPPLMTVERHLFRVLLSGEILLTLTLISGAIYLNDFFAAQNIQKAIFSFLAWLVFGFALFGYLKLNWRGKKMIIYTISGMILLSLAYFGSRAII